MKDNILNELIQNQIRDIPIEYKFNIISIVRLRKDISTSIFNKNKCCLWKGYICYSKRKKENLSINFYFNSKKRILHRLLYMNYVGKIEEDEYIKLNCNNRICCNVNHMVKRKYNSYDLIKKSIEKISSPDDENIKFEYNVILNFEND